MGADSEELEPPLNGGTVPAWWREASAGRKPQFARNFDALSERIWQRPLQQLISQEMEPFTGYGQPHQQRRAALAVLYIYVKTALQNSPMYARWAPILCSKPVAANFEERARACVDLENVLFSDFHVRLTSESPGEATNYEKSCALAKLKIQPVEDWPPGLEQRWNFLSLQVRNYNLHCNSGSPKDPERAWHQAYAILALMRSALIHPSPHKKLAEICATDTACDDVIAFLCLASFRFNQNLPKPVSLPDMNFVDEQKGATLNGARQIPPSGAVAAPRPAPVIAPAELIVLEPNESARAALGGSPPMEDPANEALHQTAELTARSAALDRLNAGVSENSTPSSAPPSTAVRRWPFLAASGAAFAAIALCIAWIAMPKPARDAQPKVRALSNPPDAIGSGKPPPLVAQRPPLPVPEILEARCTVWTANAKTKLIEVQLFDERGTQAPPKSLQYLADGLAGPGSATQLVSVVAVSGMGKSTIGQVVASRVCVSHKATFVLHLDNVTESAAAEWTKLTPSAWLQKASGFSTATTEIDAWLAESGNSPRLIVVGLDEANSAIRDALNRKIAASQAQWADLRLLMLTRNHPGLRIGDYNFTQYLRLPRLDSAATEAAAAQILRSKAEADKFFAWAMDYKLTVTRKIRQREEYRFLSTFDNLQAAIATRDKFATEQPHDRRDVFSAWLEIRLPKQLSASLSNEQLWAWLDNIVEARFAGAPSAPSDSAALQAACKRLPIPPTLPNDACDRLFSPEAMLDDGDGPGQHTVAALLTARRVADRLVRGGSCSAIEILDGDAAAFLLGARNALPCAGAVIRTICAKVSGSIENAEEIIDAGLSFDDSARRAWLKAATKSFGSDAGDACAAEVVSRLSGQVATARAGASR